MNKIICSIFLLVTLLAVISTPTAAAGLEKRWGNCCPVAQCVFKKNRKRTNNKSKFDGFIQFTETFNNQLYVSGFLDFEKVQKGVPADLLYPPFDVHVTNCNDFSFNNIEGGLDLDFVDKIFDLPFATVVQSKNINDVVGKCCIVAKDEPNNKHKIVGVAKVKQTIKCKPNQIDL